MDFFLSRYRHLTVLLIVITAQLLLIAYQVKTNKDIPLIRVWAVTAVTPVETGLELVRRYTWGFVEDYFVLLGVRGQNEKLLRENGQLKIENNYLKAELSTADRARALSVFQARSPSKTVAARVIGNGTGANSKVVFVDRGSTSGVESGMAVVTPDGIVGKVVDAYPTASLVMLITDPTFAAGVVSQKNRVHGTLKGQGHAECLVDYVQNEEHVDIGEWFYTSGDDRIFPKGFPVGQVTAAPNGKTFKEIYVSPSGMQGGVEEVLIVLQGVHQEVPGSGNGIAGAIPFWPAPRRRPLPDSGRRAPAGRSGHRCGPSARHLQGCRHRAEAHLRRRARRDPSRPTSPRFLPSMASPPLLCLPQSQPDSQRPRRLNRVRMLEPSRPCPSLRRRRSPNPSHSRPLGDG